LVKGSKDSLGSNPQAKLYICTDPIADYLTRVRNAVAANHKVVEIPASNLKKK
jgi:small subunit ribosomal protein S8